MTSETSAGVSRPGLSVPPETERAVGDFVDHVRASYGDDLVAIVAFGSAVTGEYVAGESDVNLLVVYGSLDVEDLDKVGALSRRWLRARMLAPRFLSRRNFDDYVSHFPVDILGMRGASVVLWGAPLLESVDVRPDALRWQATYEIKAMRLRIKQQFWRVADDPAALRRVLGQRFISLTHLMRAALALRGLDAPVRRADVITAALTHLGLDRTFVEQVTRLRETPSVPDRAALVTLFGALFEAIRTIDAAIGEARP